MRWQDMLFCDFWWRGGLSELQMCMAFRVGFIRKNQYTLEDFSEFENKSPTVSSKKNGCAQ